MNRTARIQITQCCQKHVSIISSRKKTPVYSCSGKLSLLSLWNSWQRLLLRFWCCDIFSWIVCFDSCIWDDGYEAYLHSRYGGITITESLIRVCYTHASWQLTRLIDLLHFRLQTLVTASSYCRTWPPVHVSQSVCWWNLDNYLISKPLWTTWRAEARSDSRCVQLLTSILYGLIHRCEACLHLPLNLWPCKRQELRPLSGRNRTPGVSCSWLPSLTTSK